MDAVLTPITEFAEVVAARRAGLFEAAVRAAYVAGASRDTLLMAVDVACQLAEVPAPLAAEALAAVHRWSWIAARRGADPDSLLIPSGA
jgi:hypothetical protein